MKVLPVNSMDSIQAQKRASMGLSKTLYKRDLCRSEVILLEEDGGVPWVSWGWQKSHKLETNGITQVKETVGDKSIGMCCVYVCVSEWEQVLRTQESAQ